MAMRGVGRLLVSAGVILAASPACIRRPPAAEEKLEGSKAPATRKPGVVAEVGGKPITQRELDLQVADRLGELRQQEYEARRDALEEMVSERLFAAEAAARGLSTEALLAAEVDAKVTSPDPKAAEAIYEKNRARLEGRPRDQVLREIEAMLRRQGGAERRAAFRKELARKAGVRVFLEAPRVEVKVPANAPSLGPADAPVTIVEFADYQCPYCQSAQATVEEVLKRYPGKVRLVHRDFPLDNHARAVPAARAARCAGEQQKFWEYHRDLLSARTDFSDQDLKKRAGSLGLNLTTFSSCLAYEGADAEIRSAMESGRQLGVTATPTFFINGRMLVGARPIDQFEQVIEEELSLREARR
jgi:protein-disulfide isomerase